jgi:DNA polymerase elongation subunit (family B)
MFKAIYYNPMNNKIHLWEATENNKTRKLVVEPEIDYYVVDDASDSGVKDIYDNPVKKVKSNTIRDMRDFVEYSNTQTCETAVSQEVKFLQKQYLNQKLESNLDNFNICTLDIELEAGTDFPDDISDSVIYPINLITAHYSKTNELITFGTKEYTGDNVKNFHYCCDEETLLTSFLNHFRKQRVNILTGWFLDTFDTPYIVNRCDKLNINISLSPINIVIPKKVRDDYGNTRNIYQIAGISILDGCKLYKKFTYTKQVSYSLNAIGLEEVNEGKLDLEGQVNHIYKTDWNKFVEYNVQDVLLTKKINDHTKFIELVIDFCYEALIPFENVFSSIALITGYILKYLHLKNLVLPDPDKHRIKELIPGAYVMAKPGLWEYVISYDVESMYPHMIMQYNISPETLVFQPENVNGLIKTPLSDIYECETPSGKFSVGGVYYKKDKQGILPEIIEDVFKQRKYFKNKFKIAKGIEDKLSIEEISKNTFMDFVYVEKLYNEIIKEGLSSKYYDRKQLILKILLNSVYGCVAQKNFSFYNPQNAMAITIGGRHLIQYLSDNVNKYIKEYWHKIANKYYPDAKDTKRIKNDIVCLIDTDSSYLSLKEIIDSINLKFNSNEEFRLWAIDFDHRILKPFFEKILDIYAKKFGIKQMINFKREKIITKKLILAKKKYADLVLDDEGKIYKEPKLAITGIEIVKTSTPKFCREKLKECLKFIMEENDKEKTLTKIRNIYKEFLTADLPIISLPKSVNVYSQYAKPIDEYIKRNSVYYATRTPQAVKAAINYNFLITKHKLSLQPIGNGSSIMVFKVNPKNELMSDVIGFIGKYPEEFKSIFKIDYDSQWKISFEGVIQRFFDAIGWGQIQLTESCLDEFIVF